MSRLLVVDDEPAIRYALRDILASVGHEVSLAADGFEGWELAKTGTYDLVISDISMPRLSGIELLSRLEAVCPRTHRVLLTAHSLEDYIEQLLGHNLSCVLTKSVPFPVEELLATVEALLSRNIFGVDRHLPAIERRETRLIHTHSEMVHACETMANLAPERRRNHVLTILNELVTNAIYYGSLDCAGDSKEHWNHDFLLGPGQEVAIEFAEGSGRKAISVLDHGGRLKRQTVLHWLHRQMTHDENGLPVGIFDNHGRGFFISRSFSDRLVISIEKGHRSEVTLILYEDAMPLGEKPLVILEV